VGRKKLVRKAEPASKRGIAWPRWTGFRRKTVWDWLQLLIVPFVLAVIGFYFTSAQEYAHQLELEARRAAEARELEAQRLQNAALQTYLEGMRQLLLDKDLLASEEGSSLRAIATAQTLSSLGQMSPEGKGIALQFLYESALVQKGEPIVDLKNADLSEADLRLYNLSNANLSDTNLFDANLSDASLLKADLSGANLSDANLAYANLAYTNLRYASLAEANLRGANLSDATLNEAYMKGANLSDANLAYANLAYASLDEGNLNGADLSGADLSNANLSGADLGGAEGVTRRELEESHATLERATLPDGSIYED
jgi:uncharacterized protein YjbI with pentapeptide repeats